MLSKVRISPLFSEGGFMHLHLSRGELFSRLCQLKHPDIGEKRRHTLASVVINGFFWCLTSRSSSWVLEVQQGDFSLDYFYYRLNCRDGQSAFEQVYRRVLLIGGSEAGEEDKSTSSFASNFGFEPDRSILPDEVDDPYGKSERVERETKFLEALWDAAGRYYVFALVRATEGASRGLVRTHRSIR